MERGILVRLAEILGWKRKQEAWDGVERRKPRAVIGIPYSSDATENTTTETEEKTMKRIGKYAFGAAVAAAAAILASCGGGGGGGATSSAGGTTGTAVVSTGTMTKGSVIVNGVRFAAAAGATIRVDDNPGRPEAELRDGMEVKVKGRVNDDRVSGQFEKVEAEPRVRGQMTGKGADDFDVHNHHVITDDNTVFEDRVAGVFSKLNNGVNDLANGNEVEIHGGLDDLGNIRATRVERRDDNPNDEVRGVVTAKVGNVISIGGFSIDIGGVPTSPPGHTVIVGDLVEVHLNAAGTAATLVDIEDLEDAEFEPAEGQETEVEGFVSGYAGGAAFQVNGVDVALKASTIFVNGSLADLANGSKVEVEGHRKGAVLEADKVKFKNTRIILSGSASVNPPPTLLEKTLRYTSASRNSWSGPGSGKNAEVRGYDDGTGKVVVEELRDATSGGNKDIVQARVAAETGNVLTIFGFTADLTGTSVNNLHDNKGGTYPTLAAFLAAITPASATPPGTLVKVKGTVTGGTFTPVDEAEIEFEN